MWTARRVTFVVGSHLLTEGGWRLFRLDTVSKLQLLPETFAGPRPGFNPEDAHFVEVFCRLSAPATGGMSGADGSLPAS